MEGLLKEKNEIEKLQREFKKFLEQKSEKKEVIYVDEIYKEELVLEECEL